ncbi:MAG: hypothetical protein K6G50_06695 [bacterium]|nr:hypothetical protein [bacterium]
MDMKTSLAAGIDIAKNKADYDAACKRLLSEKIILAWIMKSCLDEFRGFDVNFIAEKCIEGTPFISEIPVNPDETVPVIQGMGQEQSSLTEGNITFDIYFNAIVPGTEEPVHIIINMEAQGDFYPGYSLLKRGFYYIGRMLSAQKGTVFTKDAYDKLRKVYSIWICMDPPSYRKNTITSYHIAETSLVSNVKEDAANYDLLTVIMICLDTEKDAKFDGILKLLGVLFSEGTTPAEKKQILQDDFNIPMTQTLEKKVTNMGSLADGIEARGIEKGMELGKSEGIESVVLAMLKAGKYAIEEIASLSGLSVDQVKALQAELTAKA